MKKPIVLTILDGYGLREEEHGNAVALANNPVFTELWEKYPHTTLTASGQLVGLPKGQMGNSEVGHMNIGAGRIVYQPLELINKSIEDNEFFTNETIKNVYLHLFTDGRDVPPKSAYTYIEKVEEKIKELGLGKIASISGRYYAMDRDNNYDRLIKAYDVIVNNKGEIQTSPKEYIETSYEDGITDEFFLPAKFTENGNVEENDGIIAFNFRKDRLRELFTALTNPAEVDMETVKFNNVKTITMMPVVESVKAPHAFSDPKLTNILGEYIEKQNLSQLRIAETEKYAHVTFFFDGGKEVDYKNEKKILVPSPKVATYDLKPEMSADEVTEKLLTELSNTDLVILNFANGDMVGHTGVLEAAIKAVETVDKNLKLIYDKVMELGGTLIVTADHGNCEEMLDDDDNIITSHTTNPVPFIITEENITLHEGKLGDIAPTILELMNLEKPVEMTGESLIEK